METESGERLLTVKDIAECIAFDKSEDGINKTIRQVRHWTQSDLLRPYSEKTTGKGIPRLYAVEPTVHIAAFFIELTRYGVTVDILKLVSDELYEHEFDEFGPEGWYVSTALTHMNSFLQVAWRTDLKTGQFIGAEINLFDDMDIRGEDSTFLLEEPSSSILVNMTQVMERIYPLPWMD